MHPKSIYQQRIKVLLDMLPADSAALVKSAQLVNRGGGYGEYPFRQDSDFYYLTGFSEPNAYLLILPNAKPQVVLFNEARDLEKEKWIGRRLGQVDAPKELAVDVAYEVKQFEKRLPKLLKGYSNVFILKHQQDAFELKQPVDDLDELLNEMRLFKTPAEIELMQKAGDISAQAHIAAMRAAKPGLYEYSLEAEVVGTCIKHGARSMGYESIVASGKNACILHYNSNNAQLQEGDLVLIDAGCEWGNYSADISRTFPVNGKFSPEQKALYEVVLNAQQQVVELVKPGVVRKDLEARTITLLTEGLFELGILQGDLAQLIESKAVRQFYYHGVSHWLGLDVHDVGAYEIDGESRVLEAGMVLTVEPGLYMNPTDNLDPKWHNIGIRIEDDVLVTENGPHVLSAGVPKTVAEIEVICNNTVVT